jgi:hypothetical protein
MNSISERATYVRPPRAADVPTLSMSPEPVPSRA